MVKHSSELMKRLITKIQKLQHANSFNLISDLAEFCSPMKFIYGGYVCEIISFYNDGVQIFSKDGDCSYQDVCYDELSKNVLEHILEAFEETIISNDKYDSVQHYASL